MAVATPFISSVWQFFDDNGDPAAGYQLFFYETGTSNKKTTYADYAQVGSNANPVVLDSAGRAEIFLSGVYDIVLAPDTDTDPPTSPIWTATAVTDIETLAATAGDSTLRADLADATNGAGNGANLVAIAIADAEVTAGVTPTNVTYPEGNARRYGATGGGVAYDTTAIQAAISVVNDVPTTSIVTPVSIPDVGGGEVFLPAGTYLVTSLTIPGQVTLRGEGKATKLVVSGTINLTNQTDDAYDACFYASLRDLDIVGLTGTETLVRNGASNPALVTQTHTYCHLVDCLFTNVRFRNAAIGHS